MSKHARILWFAAFMALIGPVADARAQDHRPPTAVVVKQPRRAPPGPRLPPKADQAPAKGAAVTSCVHGQVRGLPSEIVFDVAGHVAVVGFFANRTKAAVPAGSIALVGRSLSGVELFRAWSTAT